VEIIKGRGGGMGYRDGKRVTGGGEGREGSGVGEGRRRVRADGNIGGGGRARMGG